MIWGDGVRLGGFLPPSPPAKKTPARQDQAGQSSTGNGAGDARNRRGEEAVYDVVVVKVLPHNLPPVIDTEGSSADAGRVVSAKVWRLPGGLRMV